MKKPILIVACLFLTIPCMAEIILVDDQWPLDFNNIQAAIDYSSPGDCILVFPGTYTGTGNRDIDFLGKAITVSSINPKDPNVVASTVIDCNSVVGEEYYTGFIFHSGEDANSVLSGFTITRGSPAIECQGSSPVIAHCVITGNSYLQEGVIDIHDSSPTITNCTIADNFGSGIYFRGYCYEEDYGYNCSTLTVENCTLTGNTGWGRMGSGGAISTVFGGICIINNSVISGNNVDQYGGGIYCERGTVEIADCIITGNSAGEDGGGIICYIDGVIEARNCTIIGNSAGYDGGGIWCEDNASEIDSCILWANSDSSGAGQSAQIYGSDAQVWFSCIQDDDPNDDQIPFGEVNGNIDDDPCFVTPGYWDANSWIDGDYHLLAGSPCIETGNPYFTYNTNDVDIDGQPRVMGQYVDMGADEFELSMIIVTKPQAGDVWTAGSTHQIEWDSSNISGNVDIHFQVPPFVGHVIVPATGSYTWHILPAPPIDSNQCLVWIEPNTALANFTCTPSGFFTIHPDSTGPPVASDWKSLGGDYDRAGLSEHFGPETGCIKWQFQTDEPVSASPTVGANGQIHLACEDGNLYTLDPNGQLLWSYDANSPLLSAPSVGPDGSVFVGAQNGKLYAVDPNGNLRWTHATDSFIYSSPAVSPDGDIYACSQDGTLYALGPDGSELWTFQVAGPGVVSGAIFASPAIGPDGTVYISGFYDPNLYALDPNAGSVKWNCDFSQFLEPNEWEPNDLKPWVFASPVVAQDGTIYQTLIYNPEQIIYDYEFPDGGRPFWYDSKLYAIDPNNGTVLWATNMTETAKQDEEPFPTEPNYWFKKYYADGSESVGYPYTYTDWGGRGTKRYYRVTDSSWSEPVLSSDEIIYSNFNDQYLRAVEPNGTIKEVTSLGWFGGFTMTVGSDGLVYTASDEGYLSVVDPNGKEVARFESDGRLSFPVIAADNLLLICDSENTVWAVTGDDCEGQPAALHRPEDLNTDWSVNLIDFAVTAGFWLECTDTSYDPVADAPYCEDDDNEIFLLGDINRDQYVNFDDLADLANRWLNEE